MGGFGLDWGSAITQGLSAYRQAYSDKLEVERMRQEMAQRDYQLQLQNEAQQQQKYYQEEALKGAYGNYVPGYEELGRMSVLPSEFRESKVTTPQMNLQGNPTFNEYRNLWEKYDPTTGKIVPLETQPPPPRRNPAGVLAPNMPANAFKPNVQGVPGQAPQASQEEVPQEEAPDWSAKRGGVPGTNMIPTRLVDEYIKNYRAALEAQAQADRLALTLGKPQQLGSVGSAPRVGGAGSSKDSAYVKSLMKEKELLVGTKNKIEAGAMDSKGSQAILEGMGITKKVTDPKAALPSINSRIQEIDQVLSGQKQTAKQAPASGVPLVKINVKSVFRRGGVVYNPGVQEVPKDVADLAIQKGFATGGQ